MHGNRNPCNSLPMVNMASGMDRGRVRPTTTTATWRQQRRRATWRPYSSYYQVMQSWLKAYIFDIGHPCYRQLTPVKTKYPLTGIT